LRLSVAESPAAAAQLAADALAAACREAVAVRGRAFIAVSGGTTPRAMLAEFARHDLPWTSIVVAQVDERCVPRDDPRRNLATLEQALVRTGPLPAANLVPVPVTTGATAAEIAQQYQRALRELAPGPLTFDVVQLGLGEDGHTASLVPGDPVLDVADADVGATRTYQGTERVTLTRPALDRARQRLWMVTGAAKAQALVDLMAGTAEIPAIRIRRDATLVVADRAAAFSLPASPF
jgi:6-phosphogluconolactonase